MLEIICWKWKPAGGYRSSFTAEHVNIWAAMMRRGYRKPHRLSVITDDAAGIDPDIRVIPLWPDLAHLPNPSYRNGPSCYRRLKAFSREAAALIGPRFVSIDLDMVVTGDLIPVFDRQEEFVIWQNEPGHYNGSLWMMTAGARSLVWETFDADRSPQLAHAAGKRGSDQGWIAHCLGEGEATWTKADGVYSYRHHIAPNRGALPADARIVSFEGHEDPWGGIAQTLPWVKSNWCKA